jgi:hypothetical protein
MDIKQSLQDKSADLIKKAAILPGIDIKWQPTIEIDCSLLTDRPALVKTKILDVFEDFKDHPAIYFYKIKSEIDSKTVVDALKYYKDRKERSCPKIAKGRSLDSKYLYCGSRKEGLHGRFIQHLGFGSKNTYSLQLAHWAQESHLLLEYNYAWLDFKYVDYTELVESALAIKIQPLVGKMA